jgi:hypothetical protein
MTLSCPGSKVNRTKSNMVVVKCVQKDIFLLNTTIVDIDQLDCTRNPSEKEMLARKGEGCGPELTAQISQLGFQLGRELTPLVTVCHAKQGAVTHYTNHTLLGHLLHTCCTPGRCQSTGLTLRRGDFISRACLLTVITSRVARRNFLQTCLDLLSL